MTQVTLSFTFDEEDYDLILALGNGDPAEGMRVLLMMGVSLLASQVEAAKQSGAMQ